ncbi:arginyl-tRNA synthetase [Spongiibacter sp. IMCC21906]|uniref:arginine--tRNA ligase n=1 Tax=Spongiibacter sp. IMCC21906 TaxID=1620392 RepID=UPI00062DF2C2|nr:arginine--tRNA ligase [Spongiibacter sp. IMCC21906]AKH68349.1 arginyl-tRNA synthetase [Spongiibacter sp. IMCC21906]
MKDTVADLINQAVQSLRSRADWPEDLPINIQIERTRDKTHGDLACNIAMTLAKPLRSNPRVIAQQIIDALPASDAVVKVEIAGPGFINFFLNEASAYQVIHDIFAKGDDFGRLPANGQKVQVEFVSANPTGPLHVGHGRGAAYGACVADMLEATGYEVCREYYVNDAGRQMDILGTSVWLRYLQACGEELSFPSNAYQGDYIEDYGRELLAAEGEKLRHSAAEVFSGICADAPEGDKETHIDELINKAKNLLGDDYQIVFDKGLNAILSGIRVDLAEFGVNYQEWFSERSLTENPNQVEAAISKLQENGFIEERDGALWFLSTQFGDDKDRVVKRENGQTTYFASDIAYHKNKFERGFDKVINIWGADHHGYIARVKAALQALKIDQNKLVVRLVQFVSLFRGDQQVQMSTRSGSFVTLRELRDDVGNDAARFFYIMRKADQATDFDLELAKSESKDNPVYYIQYAHARVASILRKLAESGQAWSQEAGLAQLPLLTEDTEKALLVKLSRYPEVLSGAAEQFEPHTLAHYLRELAGDFHTYYNAHKMLGEDKQLRDARLALSVAVQQVLRNGLHLLGVTAPEEM